MNDVKLGSINLAGVANVAERSGRVASSPQKKPEQVGSTTADVAGNSQASVKKAEQAEQNQTGSVLVKAQEQQREELEQAVTKLNDYIQSVQRDLQFNVDDTSGRMVVKVVDRNTDEVVRQIPDELALKMARNLQQEEPLSLFTMKV